MKNKENLKVKGHVGTWYVIEESYYKGEKVYLVESEQYGDMAAWLWIDKDLNVVIDEAYNGLLDLIEAERM